MASGFLTMEEERAYQVRIKAGDNRAKHEFIMCYLPLVRNIARHYASYSEYEDNVQTGVLGLYRALETHDPELGAPFGVYARYWVRSYIQRSQMSRLERASTVYRQGVCPEGELQDSTEEIEDQLDSLEEKNILQDYLSNHADKLSPRERELLHCLLVQRLSTKEVAEEMNTARQYVQQLTVKLYKKLRRGICKQYPRGLFNVK